MSFRPSGGSWTTRHYRSKASTTYTKGTLISFDGTELVPATSSSGNIVGIIDKTKASSDTSNDRIPVKVPRGRGCTMICDDVSGTATAQKEGKNCDVGSDAGKADLAATTYKVLRLEKFISATEGEFSINDPIS